jgi:hypothetical protein
MGYTRTGEPVVADEDVRAWLRRADPRADETSLTATFRVSAIDHGRQ